MSRPISNVRPAPDKVLVDIVDYVNDYKIIRAKTYRMARYCLIDALGCALEALSYPACTKLLGPVVPDIVVSHGARVPGTQFQLDPVRAAFNIGCMIRWLDFNDGFAGGGHPSENLGGILAIADYLSRRRLADGKRTLLMRDVLTAMIKAYEIQGVLSLATGFPRLGFDTTELVKVASTAVVTKMLGGSREQIINAVSNAWADGLTLNVYRQAPNIGSRKSWAGGDATSRAVDLGLMALKGEMGYPSVLTAKTFGFYDALFKGSPFKFQRSYGSYVLEHVVFKFVAAQILGQSAVECALKLHPLVKNRIDDIESVTLTTQEALMRLMNKTGPLNNPAHRDHCAQYVVAVGMIYGRLIASDFEDEFAAADPRIDLLRAKIKLVEDQRYTQALHDPAKRSSANAIEVRFKDGTRTPKFEVEYPIGHPRRRAEAIPLLEAKLKTNLARRFPPPQQDAILKLCRDQALLEATPVNEFLDRFVI